MTAIYRIDKFRVPTASRDAFLAAAFETHRFLETLPGHGTNQVLEQVSGPGTFNFVTVVEWESDIAFERAKTAMTEFRRTNPVDTAALLEELRIDADMANYAALPTPAA